MFSMLDIIGIAVQLEKNGEKVYRRTLSRVDDVELKKMLSWFADEEVRHARFFASLKKDIAEDSMDLFHREMSRELIEEFVKDQMFSLKDVDIDQYTDINDLLGIFIEFEQDTLLFFEMLKPFVADSAYSEKMDAIINEEKSHIRQLDELLAARRGVRGRVED